VVVDAVAVDMDEDLWDAEAMAPSGILQQNKSTTSIVLMGSGTIGIQEVAERVVASSAW